jgi:hypothetical protein
MQQAQVRIEPPANVKLREGDRPYWDALTACRAPSEWNSTDLQHAANLARCQHDIERISHEVQHEGDVIMNAKGTLVVNPLHALLETLSRRSVALTRLLHLHAQERNGRPNAVVKGRAVVERARVALSDVEDDGLIPLQ